MVFAEKTDSGYARDSDGGYRRDERRALSEASLPDNLCAPAGEGPDFLHGDGTSAGNLGERIFSELGRRGDCLGHGARESKPRCQHRQSCSWLRANSGLNTSQAIAAASSRAWICKPDFCILLPVGGET